MRTAAIVLAAFLSLATLSFTEGGQAQQSAAYCEAGSDALTVFERSKATPPPDPVLVYENCKPGDSIMIPGQYSSFIAQVCDFSRTITYTVGLVLCVVGPQRSVRTNRN